jgi:hypothetical protein
MERAFSCHFGHLNEKWGHDIDRPETKWIRNSQGAPFDWVGYLANQSHDLGL